MKRPPTTAERSATRAVDLWKNADCKGFDPERSDHVHGRAGAPPILFDRMEGVKVFGCEACCYGERYKHTCGRAAIAAGESLALEMGSPYDTHILDKLREASC